AGAHARDEERLATFAAEGDVGDALRLIDGYGRDLHPRGRQDGDALAARGVQIAGAVHPEAVGAAVEALDPDAGPGRDAAVGLNGIRLDAVRAGDVERLLVRREGHAVRLRSSLVDDDRLGRAGREPVDARRGLGQRTRRRLVVRIREVDGAIGAYGE